jgi:hypothetical protein
MDNVQNYDSYINIPSLQTYRSYSFNWFIRFREICKPAELLDPLIRASF